MYVVLYYINSLHGIWLELPRLTALVGLPTVLMYSEVRFDRRIVYLTAMAYLEEGIYVCLCVYFLFLYSNLFKTLIDVNTE